MSLLLLQQHIDDDAFIAQEIERRLLENSCKFSSTQKKIDILRCCAVREIVSAKLPYLDASVDVVVANLVLLWQQDCLVFFEEIRRILTERGVFLFSTLGVENLPSFEKLGDQLLTLVFDHIVMEREILELSYENIVSAEQELILSGINNKFIKKCISPHEVTLSLEIIYGYALKSKKESSTTIEVPVKAILSKSKSKLNKTQGE